VRIPKGKADAQPLIAAHYFVPIICENRPKAFCVSTSRVGTVYSASPNWRDGDNDAGALVVRAVVALILLTFLAPPARADDVLLQAVSFAITGSDGAKVTAIDRAQCVFKVEDDTYFLNNVYVDRISIRNWGAGVVVFATVDLHGKKKVVDSSPAKHTGSAGSAFNKMKMQDHPDYSKGGRTAESDKTIMIWTSESDRLVKAWEYIYANGCQGATSPF
jgi:hypothetical protein